MLDHVSKLEAILANSGSLNNPSYSEDHHLGRRSVLVDIIESWGYEEVIFLTDLVLPGNWLGQKVCSVPDKLAGIIEHLVRALKR